MLGGLFSVFFFGEIRLITQTASTGGDQYENNAYFRAHVFALVCVTFFGAEPNRHSRDASDGFTPNGSKRDGASTVLRDRRNLGGRDMDSRCWAEGGGVAERKPTVLCRGPVLAWRVAVLVCLAGLRLRGGGAVLVVVSWLNVLHKNISFVLYAGERD